MQSLKPKYKTLQSLAQVSSSQPTPLPKRAHRKVGKSPTYDGDLERLFSVLQGLKQSAERNFQLATTVFMKYRREAGFVEVKEIEVLEKILSEKKDKEGLNEKEAPLSRTIEIFNCDHEICQSVQALTGAVQEFSKPPCFLTKKHYDDCLKNLNTIKTLVDGNFAERQTSLSSFPDGQDWKFITRYFYNYTIYAVETASKNLEAAFHSRHHSDPEEEIWIKESRRFQAIIKSSHKVLSREDLDQAGYRFRREIYFSLEKAKQEVLVSRSAQSSEKILGNLYQAIEINLDDLKTHINHQLRTRSTASLAHIPVSRRSLIRY